MQERRGGAPGGELNRSAPAAGERGGLSSQPQAQRPSPSTTGAGSAETGRGPVDTGASQPRRGQADSDRGGSQLRRDQADTDRGQMDNDRGRASRSGQDATHSSRDADQNRRSTTRQSRERDGQDRNRAAGQNERHRGDRATTGTERGDRATSRGERGDRGEAATDRANRTDRGMTRDTQGAGSRDTSRRSTEERGTALSMTQEQRTRVSERFSARIDSMHVRALSRASFSVSVGAMVPRSVTLYDVPRDVVAIYPQYRGHKFVLVEDEIVVIAPGSRRVVAVLPRGGGGHAAVTRSRTTTGARQGGIHLTQSQREVIRTTIMRDPTCRLEQRLDFSIGLPLPRTVEVCEFPATLISEVPEMRGYRFVMRGDEIAIVDPREREVIDVIE
jgi:hypothetical protein